MFIRRIESSSYKNNLCFKSGKLNYKTVLQESVNQIDKKIKTKSFFTEKDIPWLKSLSNVLGLNEPINYQDLNIIRKHSWSGQILNYKEKLFDTLKVLLFTLHNKPSLKEFQDYKIQINNQEIGKLLKKDYNKETFDSLYNESEKHGCFDIDFNKYGFPITTPISEFEERDMSVNTWITDTLRCANLIKNRYPFKYNDILDKISAFYKLEN